MVSSKINQIYDSAREFFISFGYTKREYSIFLCGASSRNNKSLRAPIKDEIKSIRSNYNYLVYYPEDLFVELIYGHRRRDLLQLENLLARSVNAIAILVESAGAIAELGAFSNHEKLANKLIIIADSKYENDNSFINQGPIRYLKTKTKSKVKFFDICVENQAEMANFIVNSTREISQNYPIEKSVLNPIHAYRFYLALIYIFDPIEKSLLLKIIEKNEKRNPNDLDLIDTVETVISWFHTEGKIYTTPQGFSITGEGRKDLIESNTHKATYNILEFLRPARIEALNITLRKKYNDLPIHP